MQHAAGCYLVSLKGGLMAVWAEVCTVISIALAVATGIWFSSTALLAAIQALEMRRSPAGRRIPWYYTGPHPGEAQQVVRQLTQRQVRLRPLGAS